jgi:hypothetical protein
MAVSRKAKKDVMTIPQLRQSMAHITNYAHNLVKSKKQNPVKAFQSEWQATFRKPLADKVAKEYLKHIAKYKSKTMKRKQRGGMAPLAYRMEPGAPLPYGNFPEYLTKGFFVPMSTNIANCGVVNSTVIPAQDLGSNLVTKTGGGRRRTLKRGGADPISSFVQGLTTIASRPFASVNPPSFQQTALNDLKGYLPPPGSDPSQKTWQHLMPQRGLVPLPVADINNYNPLSSVGSTSRQ